MSSRIPITNSESITLSFEKAIKAYHRLLKTVKTKTPPKSTFACKTGCNICCVQELLPVTAVEVFHLEDYLRKTLSSAELDELIDALDHINNIKTIALNSKMLPPIYPCPFVKTNTGCSVYEARPLCCRGHNSYQVSDCENALKDGLVSFLVRQYFPQIKAARDAKKELQNSLQQNNLEANILDLHLALRIVLSESDAKSRWLAGEIVFEAARKIT